MITFDQCETTLYRRASEPFPDVFLPRVHHALSISYCLWRLYILAVLQRGKPNDIMHGMWCVISGWFFNCMSTEKLVLWQHAVKHRRGSKSPMQLQLFHLKREQNVLLKTFLALILWLFQNPKLRLNAFVIQSKCRTTFRTIQRNNTPYSSCFCQSRFQLRKRGKGFCVFQCQ